MSEKRFDYIWKDVKDDRGLSEIHDFFIDNFSNKEYDLSYEEDIGYFLDLLDRLSDENEQLRQQVQNAKEIAVKNDMQYQICRKEKEDFQDMCEQLRKELDNFKPVMFQDMRKGTVILYSKGGYDE